MATHCLDQHGSDVRPHPLRQERMLSKHGVILQVESLSVLRPLEVTTYKEFIAAETDEKFTVSFLKKTSMTERKEAYRMSDFLGGQIRN